MKKWVLRIFGGLSALLVLAIVVLAVVVGYTSDCPPADALAGEGESMTAVIYRCYGSTEVLEVTAVDKPQPVDNEILVKVQVASVNPLDWHFMRGSPYLMRLMSGIGTPEDTSMGVDFAGTVVAVGKDVTQFEVGDEVFGGRSGAFAEYVIVPEDRGIVLKPPEVSFEQAAALPIAAITALQAVRDKGELKSGQKVLINGASGGVGTYAVQIAKAMGAKVHGVCSTRNVELVRSLGAERVFDYRNEDYTESEEVYDVIIDMVGNHSLLKNRRVMTDDGILVMVGGSKGDWIDPLLGPIGAMLLSPFVDQQFKLLLAELNKADLNQLAEYVRSGEVRSVIDQRFTLNEVPDAIRYSEAGRARGKIIISSE